MMLLWKPLQTYFERPSRQEECVPHALQSKPHSRKKTNARGRFRSLSLFGVGKFAIVQELLIAGCTTG
ncbi:uncharacterized protein PHALS_11101 [Plasmopara halstedii]|uniref:Uncharacterized protein n=1 Tax=Plasmopara halstedii TaxID=4781 RepID=A0A0P1AK56_PLAHL|nr:uncharacterized protein PHALS_11101 [Plasmopara halstedii]CEG40925.1 hypothetical protein PHALS_11101 [Plasmopara halstedii]|eukprot:XP_024577294.1 hypothetical protein PHALS_11101 [Plasmopara halstedii]